ncbi:hypothetical protein BJX66DRAFT_316325 [Aspergillus keveii]|uniref:F-box domain-containing protein n=1 Tax=Aspergillus keveii TaxID=714993 RepID=A0ABR4FN98_9EURO
MDPFARLPWFILKNILSDLPDLFSLHRLCTPSPAIATFLSESHAQFAQVVNAIMARPSHLLPYVWDLARLLILIWSPDAHAYAEIPPDIMWAGSRPPSPQLPILRAIPLSTPSTLLFKLVDLLVGLRRVTHKCFHSMIDKCLKLRVEYLPPREPIREGQGMRPGKYRRSNGFPTDPSKRPQGIPYVPVDIGPPTRMEEQRILGCLLHIVFYHEFRAVYAEPSATPEVWQHMKRAPMEELEAFWPIYLQL